MEMTGAYEQAADDRLDQAIKDLARTRLHGEPTGWVVLYARPQGEGFVIGSAVAGGALFTTVEAAMSQLLANMLYFAMPDVGDDSARRLLQQVIKEKLHADAIAGPAPLHVGQAPADGGRDGSQDPQG